MNTKQLPFAARAGRGSVVAVIAMALAMMLAIFVGLLVFGVAMFSAKRTVTHRQMASQAAERMRAVQQREVELLRGRVLDRPRVVEVPAASTGEMEAQKKDDLIRVAHREITIELDAEGKIKVDGAVIEAEKLQETLTAARKGRESTLAVVVRADDQCKFQHVSTVLAICKAIDVPNVRIQATTE